LARLEQEWGRRWTKGLFPKARVLGAKSERGGGAWTGTVLLRGSVVKWGRSQVSSWEKFREPKEPMRKTQSWAKVGKLVAPAQRGEDDEKSKKKKKV